MKNQNKIILKEKKNKIAFEIYFLLFEFFFFLLSSLLFIEYMKVKLYEHKIIYCQIIL